MKNPTIKYAIIHALGAAAYVALIATLVNYIPKTVDNAQQPLPAIAFLLTFVISTAIMGLLIFARPLMWYLNGQKKEALALVLYTVSFLILIALIIFITLLFQISR